MTWSYLINHLRPITVVPVLFKVIEKLIGRQIADCFIFSQSLNQTIAGFRKGRSTAKRSITHQRRYY